MKTTIIALLLVFLSTFAFANHPEAFINPNYDKTIEFYRETIDSVTVLAESTNIKKFIQYIELMPKIKYTHIVIMHKNCIVTYHSTNDTMFNGRNLCGKGMDGFSDFIEQLKLSFHKGEFIYILKGSTTLITIHAIVIHRDDYKIIFNVFMESKPKLNILKPKLKFA